VDKRERQELPKALLRRKKLGAQIPVQGEKRSTHDTARARK
jgi:hypothetical protein